MLPWVVLHFNRRIGARERRQLIPHVRFSGSISGAGKLIEIRLRMCGPPSVPTLYACCFTKRSVIFCLLHGSAFTVDFGDFAVSFLVPPDGP